MRKRSVGCGVLVLLLAARVTVAGEEPQRKEEKAAAALRLRIATEQPNLTWAPAAITHSMPARVHHGVQPTVLKVTFENGTDEPVTLQFEDGLWNSIEFNVEGPDDGLRKTDVGKILRNRPPPKMFTVEVAPGKTYDYVGWDVARLKEKNRQQRGPVGLRFPGRCGRWEYAFVKPGTYKIRARYAAKAAEGDQVWAGELLSNELTLTVPERVAGGTLPQPRIIKGTHRPLRGAPPSPR